MVSREDDVNRSLAGGSIGGTCLLYYSPTKVLCKGGRAEKRHSLVNMASNEIVQSLGRKPSAVLWGLGGGCLAADFRLEKQALGSLDS